MPTDELNKLLNKRRGKVDGDGSTFESAPVQSGSDFATLPQRVQKTRKASHGSIEAHSPPKHVARDESTLFEKQRTRSAALSDTPGLAESEISSKDSRHVAATVERKSTLESQNALDSSQSFVDGSSLLRKRREEVDTAGETWESAPVQSSTDFTSIARHTSEVDCVVPSGTDGITSFVKDGDHCVSSLLRKRREEVDAAGEHWESAPVESSTDFVAAPPKALVKSGSFDAPTNSSNISSLLEDKEVSGQELLRKRREKVDAKAQVCESVPLASSTDAVAPKPVYKHDLQESPHRSPAMAQRHRLSTVSQVESLPAVHEEKEETITTRRDSDYGLSDRQLQNYNWDNANDRERSMTDDSNVHRNSKCSDSDFGLSERQLKDSSEQSHSTNPITPESSIDRQRLGTDVSCTESLPPVDEEAPHNDEKVDAEDNEQEVAREDSEDSFGMFGEEDDEVCSLPSFKNDGYQSILPPAMKLRKDDNHSVTSEGLAKGESKLVSDDSCENKEHDAPLEDHSETTPSTADANELQFGQMEVSSDVDCRLSLGAVATSNDSKSEEHDKLNQKEHLQSESIRRVPFQGDNDTFHHTSTGESLSESDLMVEVDDVVVALRREKIEGKRSILTASKYQASRTLVLQLRYTGKNKCQNLADVSRFRQEGAYVQARSALASSLRNGRVQQRRPCASVERSAIENVATASRPASKVTLACPTGDARAWDGCPVAKLRIGELNGEPRRISRICFGQSSSQHFAIATIDGGVLICCATEMVVVRELRAPRLDESSFSGTSISDSVQALEFSPSDEMICLLSRGEVRLWRVIDGEILLTLGSKFTAIAFTPPTDGDAALACGDSQGNVQLIDCKALSTSTLRCPSVVRGKPERSIVLVEAQTVSQFGRAVIAMTFEIPWARLFVADTFAKVHLLHRHENTFVADSFVRFGNMVGIGESPQRVVSMRHVWRSIEFGKSRGVVLCLCWDKVVRLLAVGADEVTGGTQSQLQFIKSFSLAGTAWAAWRKLDGSGTCANDALLRNVEIAFLSLDVEPIAAAAWRQPMGGVAATIVTHEGLQFLGQLPPPSDDKSGGPPPASAPCGGGLLATGADGRSWASVAPNGSEVFVWRLHENVASATNECKTAELKSNKPLSCLIREDFPIVAFGRKKGTSMREFLNGCSPQVTLPRRSTECFDLADDSASDNASQKRYSVEDIEDFLGQMSSHLDPLDFSEGHNASAEVENRDSHHKEDVVGAIPREMQQLLDMGFTEADARRALLLDVPQETVQDDVGVISREMQQLLNMGFTVADARRALLLDETQDTWQVNKPLPLATLGKSLEAALSSPSISPLTGDSPSPLKTSNSSRSHSPHRLIVEHHLPDYDPEQVDVDESDTNNKSLVEFLGEDSMAPQANVASARLTELLDVGPNVDLDQLQRCCEDAIGEMWAGAHREHK